MPKMNLHRSKQINVQPDRMYSILADMGSWAKWSPWIITEPDAKIIVSNDNKSYNWEGNRVGSGEMHITNMEKNSIDYDLLFLKPWKSKAKVKFEIKEKDGGSEVIWHMDSSLPWFMFWMKKIMVAMIGNDYDRGLNLLKDYAEDGKVHSNIKWHGVESYPGGDFVGIKRTCSIDDMPNLMKKDFESLMAFAKDHPNADTTRAFSQYHKFDFVKRIASYTSGIPVMTKPSQIPNNAFVGSMKPTKVYKLEHKGPYEHLGNAWSAAYMMDRNKEFKKNKSYHPFETYGNSPMNTPSKELITYINFPVKG